MVYTFIFSKLSDEKYNDSIKDAIILPSSMNKFWSVLFIYLFILSLTGFWYSNSGLCRSESSGDVGQIQIKFVST